jgi:hypothetical protein
MGAITLLELVRRLPALAAAAAAFGTLLGRARTSRGRRRAVLLLLVLLVLLLFSGGGGGGWWDAAAEIVAAAPRSSRTGCEWSPPIDGLAFTSCLEIGCEPYVGRQGLALAQRACRERPRCRGVVRVAPENPDSDWKATVLSWRDDVGCDDCVFELGLGPLRTTEHNGRPAVGRVWLDLCGGDVINHTLAACAMQAAFNRTLTVPSDRRFASLDRIRLSRTKMSRDRTPDQFRSWYKRFATSPDDGQGGGAQTLVIRSARSAASAGKLEKVWNEEALPASGDGAGFTMSALHMLHNADSVQAAFDFQATVGASGELSVTDISVSAQRGIASSHEDNGHGGVLAVMNQVCTRWHPPGTLLALQTDA